MYRLCDLMKLCFLFGALAMMACQPTGGQRPSDFPFFIQNNQIILHKSHIMAVKTSLYQPSFAISGVILPQTQNNIIASDDGILTLLVKHNQRIAKNHTIALITPQIRPDSQTTPTDNAPKQNHAQDHNLDTGQHLIDQQEHLQHHDGQNDDINPDAQNTAPNTAPNTHAQASDNQNQQTPPIASIKIQSPAEGRVFEIYHNNGTFIHQGDIIALIGSADTFEFTAHLPANLERHLTIGQTVQFTRTKSQAPTTRLDEIYELHNTSFAGQITDIRSDDDHLIVNVQIQTNNNDLHQGMQLTGQVDYGQLAVGVIVPEHAIADGVNLKELSRPPYKALRPIDAKVWTIKQDGRAYLTDVTVLEYNPATQHYLIVGINQASLIVTANLPALAHHLPVVIR